MGTGSLWKMGLAYVLFYQLYDHDQFEQNAAWDPWSVPGLGTGASGKRNPVCSQDRRGRKLGR